jgi:hypothetical protein
MEGEANKIIWEETLPLSSPTDTNKPNSEEYQERAPNEALLKSSKPHSKPGKKPLMYINNESMSHSITLPKKPEILMLE